MPMVNLSHSRISKKSSNLLRETPEECTKALLKHVTLPHLIWEPCAGRGAISRLLTDAGHRVVAQDIRHYLGADDDIRGGFDFLKTTCAPANVQTIVTNPPYDILDEFIRHGLKLGCDVYAFLKVTSVEGADRSDIIDGHLMRMWVGIERPPFMHVIGHEGRRIKQSGTPFAWYYFSHTRRLPMLGVDLRRISWDLPNKRISRKKRVSKRDVIPMELSNGENNGASTNLIGSDQTI